MTDERLDQILKQALAPEIADTEIAVKQAGITERQSARERFFSRCGIYMEVLCRLL